MNNRDEELDQLISPFRKINVSELQIKKWKLAVENDNKIKVFKRDFKVLNLFQLSTALIVGLVLGGVLVGAQKTKDSHFSENNESNATIELIYAKAE